MWESLFGSALTPAIQAGAGEALATMTPALADTALTTGVDQALAGTLPNMLGNSTAGLGVDSVFQQLGNVPMFTGDGMLIPTATEAMNALPTAGQGLFDNFGDYTKMLGSDQAQNIAKVGFGGYNAYNQGKTLDQAKNIQNQQLAMSQDAYNRDKSADQRRQKLVF